MPSARHAGSWAAARAAAPAWGFVVLLACSAFGDASAAAAEPAAAPKDETLSRQVTRIVAAYEKTSKAVTGVSVVDLRTGRTPVAIRQAEAYIPASNQKILTAAFILARFGGNCQFVTSVYRRGDDIVVIGGYDPTLGDPVLAEQTGKTIYDQLDAWVAAIVRSTGKTIRGNILLSCPAAEAAWIHPDWPRTEHGQWYAAPVCALNFHNNCLDVLFKASNGVVEPVVSPATRFIRVVNKVELGQRNVWSMRAAADDSVVTLTGTATGRNSWPLSVPIENPPLLLGRVLAERLLRADVKFDGQIQTVGPVATSEAGLVKLADTTTPLAVVIERANKRSLNMAAECMLLRAGDGTWVGSARMMSETLIKTYGLGEGSLVVSDGSGLSRRNRVTPAALTGILAAIAGGKDAGILAKSLPVAGVDGTLSKRLAEPRYRGRITAKTGYIMGVSSLSGYALDAQGKSAAAFAILVNSIPAGKAWEAKDFQDSICRAIVDWLGKE